jgi:hypothetical protein
MMLSGSLVITAWPVLGLQIAANIQNKQSRTRKRGGPAAWGLKVGLKSPSRKEIVRLRNDRNGIRIGCFSRRAQPNGIKSQLRIILDCRHYNGFTQSTVRPRAHQGNWQLQSNLNFREISPISSRQLVSRLAGAHWGNSYLISCSYHLKWVRSSDVMHDYIFYFRALTYKGR